MKRFFSHVYAFVFLLVSFLSYRATNWLVGPTKTYTKPSQVAGLVQHGDTVSIDAGIYASDVCYWGKNNLLLRGVGGMAHLKSNGLSYGDKAIWVIGGDNVRVEYIEFSECTSTSHNGAGIRAEGKNLTIRYCYFHDNENGILGGTFNPSKVIIEHTEFYNNGYGDGLSHNLYFNHIDTLIFRYNYSHHCKIGHELKSRAKVNYILYNRFSNENGNASREIDLPNGGTCILIGNIIQQGQNSTNSGIIGYGLEGFTNPQPHQLYLINNTIVNNKSTGTFIHIGGSTQLLKMYNNIFAGAGTYINGNATTLDTLKNWRVTNISNCGFVNAASYDYKLLPTSGAINSGTNPGTASNGFNLMPVHEYVHSANKTNRIIVGNVDIGAHEYNPSASFLSNVKEENNISFFSFNKKLYIRNESEEPVLFSLYELNGKKISENHISLGVHEYDFSFLTDGIYLVNFTAYNGRKKKTEKVLFK
ncbi:MAG: hypothetical protein N3F09_01900 [Bacteroidia bacterium]|nr:hypothetical protein [Bacteroidia bacterium]